MKSTELEDVDAIFESLANVYRRRVLVALMEQHPQEDGDLRVPDDILRDTEVSREVTTRMYHVHLPKLDDVGFIQWNRESDTVEIGARFDEIRPLLQLVYENVDELAEDCL